MYALIIADYRSDFTASCKCGMIQSDIASSDGLRLFIKGFNVNRALATESGVGDL